jgi:hypothetical protein
MIMGASFLRAASKQAFIPEEDTQFTAGMAYPTVQYQNLYPATQNKMFVLGKIKKEVKETSTQESSHYDKANKYNCHLKIAHKFFKDVYFLKQQAKRDDRTRTHARTIFLGMVQKIHHGLSRKNTRMNTLGKIRVAGHGTFVLTGDVKFLRHALQEGRGTDSPQGPCIAAPTRESQRCL